MRKLPTVVSNRIRLLWFEQLSSTKQFSESVSWATAAESSSSEWNWQLLKLRAGRYTEFVWYINIFLISHMVWGNTVYMNIQWAHLKVQRRTQTELMRRKCIIQFVLNMWRCVYELVRCYSVRAALTETAALFNVLEMCCPPDLTGILSSVRKPWKYSRFSVDSLLNFRLQWTSTNRQSTIILTKIYISLKYF